MRAGPKRDGVVLLADHYAALTDTPAGTLLLRGSYTRDALPIRVILALYAERGYHVVLQSTHRTFGSAGTFEPGYGELEDGADTVGGSYLGDRGRLLPTVRQEPRHG